MSKALTDSEVELEIASLNNDPDVGLARAEHRAKYRRSNTFIPLGVSKNAAKNCAKTE